jgi:Flp pilus assembly protein TadD
MSIGIEEVTSSDSGMSDFKEGLKLLRDGHPEEALSHVQRALRLAPQNPFYLSYVGLLVAVVERRFADAESLCQDALSIRRNHPQLYLNLAEMYQTARRTRDAIDVLERGLASTGRDRRIRSALKRIGRRRLPVLPFLDRSNPLNRLLGKWRHRLLGPPRAA